MYNAEAERDCPFNGTPQVSRICRKKEPDVGLGGIGGPVVTDVTVHDTM